MKLVRYTLNADGTIPTFINDGGYFPISNELAAPQDLTFIGMTSDESKNADFLTEQELFDYVAPHGFYFENPITHEEIPLSKVIHEIWQKVS